MPVVDPFSLPELKPIHNKNLTSTVLWLMKKKNDAHSRLQMMLLQRSVCAEIAWKYADLRNVMPVLMGRQITS